MSISNVPVPSEPLTPSRELAMRQSLVILALIAAVALLCAAILTWRAGAVTPAPSRATLSVP